MILQKEVYTSWCKAQLVLDVALKADAMEDMTAAEKAEAERLLPGTRAVSATGEKLRRWTTLRLSCNLINRSRKRYSTADNKLLSSDPDFNADEANEQETERAATYRAAMAEYYRATRTVWSEGSVGLHFNGSRNPADMTGRLLHVAGLSPAWEQMNAIIRAVSWDLLGGGLSVEFGTREVLGFSERLERRNMARAATQAPQRRETMGADAMDAEANAEQESAMTVAADVATEVSAGVNGTRRKPFSLYCEGGKHYYTGGIFTALGHSFEVPHTQYTIKHGEPTSGALYHDWGVGPVSSPPCHLANLLLPYAVDFKTCRWNSPPSTWQQYAATALSRLTAYANLKDSLFLPFIYTT